MKKLPKRIHFIGIGGIGMSGIAQILLEKGIQVSGSDINVNANVERLRALGADIFIGHDAKHARKAHTVVVSTAIKASNPELCAAQEKGIPVVHRAEMLNAVMADAEDRICISGTHGKTTTTSLMAAFLDEAGENPTVINGGIINAYDSNSRIGNQARFLIEADESDGSFTHFSPTIAVITNIDAEHMEHYGTQENLENAFQKFIEQTDSKGCVIACGDDETVCRVLKRASCPFSLTYGFEAHNEVYVQNICSSVEGVSFDLFYQGKLLREAIFLKAYGAHNVLNALAVLTLAIHRGEVEKCVAALGAFQGVQRRFTPVGRWKDVLFIDDYAHHPVEIKATLSAARQVCKGRLIAVLQPHRFSRVRDHFEAFCHGCKLADYTILLPVYSAGEEKIPGATHDDLGKSMVGEVHVCDDPEGLACALQDIIMPEDMVVCMGAGSISRFARNLVSDLEDITLNRKVCA